MNILYLGPYRSTNTIGLSSLFTLYTLAKINKNLVYSRPLYFDNESHVNHTEIEHIINTEKSGISNYDILIQHAPIDYCQKIHNPRLQKNICIPILDYRLLNNNHINILSEFDSIWVDNRLDYHKISKHKQLAAKTKTYEYTILTDGLKYQTYNLGLFNHLHKFYFIGSYVKDSEIILSLLYSFVTSGLNNDNALLLFLADSNPNTKKILENHIQELFKNTEIIGVANKIVIIDIIPTFNNLSIAHQTGSIFLDIQSNNTNTINYYLAKHYNKKIIQLTPDDFYFAFNLNNSYHSSGFLCPKSDAISYALLSGIDSASKPQKRYHLRDIL